MGLRSDDVWGGAALVLADRVGDDEQPSERGPGSATPAQPGPHVILIRHRVEESGREPLSTAESEFLADIGRSPGSNVSAAARALNTLSMLVRKLSHRGLLQRTRSDHDRQVVRLDLTRRAEELPITRANHRASVLAEEDRAALEAAVPARDALPDSVSPAGHPFDRGALRRFHDPSPVRTSHPGRSPRGSMPGARRDSRWRMNVRRAATSCCGYAETGTRRPGVCRLDNRRFDCIAFATLDRHTPRVPFEESLPDRELRGEGRALTRDCEEAVLEVTVHMQSASHFELATHVLEDALVEVMRRDDLLQPDPVGTFVGANGGTAVGPSTRWLQQQHNATAHIPSSRTLPRRILHR